MRHVQGKRGFTLIEVILAVVIIGILGGIVIPKFVDQAERAKVARIQANLQAMRSAIRLWQADHDGEPPQKLSELVPDYLPELPEEALTETAEEVGAYNGSGGWVYKDGKVSVNLSAAELTADLASESAASGS